MFGWWCTDERALVVLPSSCSFPLLGGTQLNYSRASADKRPSDMPASHTTHSFFFSRSQGQGLIIFIVLGSICTQSSSTCGRTRPCHRSHFSWPPHRKNMCFKRHRMSSCMSSRNIEKHISIQMFYRRGDAMRLLRRTTQHSTTPSHRAKSDRLQYSIQLSRFAIDTTTKQSMPRLTCLASRVT